MKLLTIQPKFVYDDFLSKGLTYRAHQHLSIDQEDSLSKKIWETPYAFMVSQLIARKQAAIQTHAQEYPIWAWPLDKGLRTSLDLRTSFFKQWSDESKEFVAIEFEENDDACLLSGFHAWHAPLNCWYLTDNEEESEAFSKKVSNKGLNQYKNPHVSDDPELFSEILNTWERIFDEAFNIRYEGLDEDCAESKNKIQWQAVLFGLDPKKITRIRPFKTVGRNKS